MIARRPLPSQLFVPRFLRRLLVLGAVLFVALVAAASPVAAQQVDVPDEPGPAGPPGIELPDDIETVIGADDDTGVVNFSIDLGAEDGEGPPSESVILIIGLTLLSVAPSLVIMLTSFTRIVIVFSLVRSALGVQSIPPNQVVVGLSLFLSLFIMGPTLTEMNEVGLQPYLDGEKTQAEAYDAAVEPLREFMFAHTGTEELELMLAAQDIEEPPAGPEDVSMSALIPAFILSELKAAFIIGFVVFMPFLVIDLVVSSVLMSLGMMMLPPVFVSLPFKILLFVMVNGWVLVAETLITSFNTV
ncbi:MAG: flagellar type III secretion system pore protein FliP [Actinomycetota bacterium]